MTKDYCSQSSENFHLARVGRGAKRNKRNFGKDFFVFCFFFVCVRAVPARVVHSHAG